MRVRHLGLPRSALVNVMVRGGRAIPPRGSTRVSAETSWRMMVIQASSKELYPLMDRWRKGPMRAEITATRRSG